LLLAQVERRLEIAERLARCIEDPRAPDQIRHEVAEMIRFRALAIAAGYPDANDCDVLRKDVAFKMAVDRLDKATVVLTAAARVRLLPPAMRLHFRPLGVAQHISVHLKLESQYLAWGNPKSQQTLVPRLKGVIATGRDEISGDVIPLDVPGHLDNPPAQAGGGFENPIVINPPA